MNPKDIDHLRVFPQQEWDFDQQEYLSHGGMELRDHFAGLAMQAFFSDTQVQWSDEKLKDGARFSYKLADAMMEERKQ